MPLRVVEAKREEKKAKKKAKKKKAGGGDGADDGQGDDGAGDVLVKVATGHVELFKDAVGRLSPSALADVKAGMGRAAARARAPQQPVSPAGGGVRLDMSAYRS